MTGPGLRVRYFWPPTRRSIGPDVAGKLRLVASSPLQDLLHILSGAWISHRRQKLGTVGAGLGSVGGRHPTQDIPSAGIVVGERIGSGIVRGRIPLEHL